MRVAGSICIKEFYLHIFLLKHQSQNGQVLEGSSGKLQWWFLLPTATMTVKEATEHLQLLKWEEKLEDRQLKYE